MRQESEAAYLAAYDEYAEAIFRYCYFRIGDRERAKDLMQETFFKAWDFLAKGKEIREMRPFLYRIAHNLCVNEGVRSKARSLDEMQEATGYDPADTARSPEHDADVALLLDKLKELRAQDQELLTLRYLEGLSVAEIAETLGEKANTISVRLRRATDVLRDKMGATTP